MKKEIEKAVDVYFKENDFESPLRMAIILKNNKYVNKLLKAGASYNINKNPQRKTIFEKVAEVSDVPILQTLFGLAPINLEDIKKVQNVVDGDEDLMNLLKKFEEEVHYLKKNKVGEYELLEAMKKKT